MDFYSTSRKWAASLGQFSHSSIIKAQNEWSFLEIEMVHNVGTSWVRSRLLKFCPLGTSLVFLKLWVMTSYAATR